MPTLDVFNQDAFSLMSLTAAINKAPYKPSRIGQLGLFGEQRISTTQVMVEERDGLLSLIPTTPRGGPADSIGAMPRTVRSFVVPHLARESTILADEIQNVRAFGSENELQAVQAVVDGRLAALRAMHEVTLEYHRIGAIKGLILDADGVTPIYNLFTEFGITPQTFAWDIAAHDSAFDVGKACRDLLRYVEDNLQGERMTGIHVLVGKDFFEALTTHDDVIAAYERWQDGQALRTDMRSGFSFCGITFEEHRGRATAPGGTVRRFVEEDEGHAFPLGTMDTFATYYAPADFNETANTMALPLYAKQEPRKFDRGTDLHTQSNPLPMCHRPGVLVKLLML